MMLLQLPLASPQFGNFQYKFERQKYAQDLIDFDKPFARLFSRKPHTEQFQDGVLHEDKFLK